MTISELPEPKPSESEEPKEEDKKVVKLVLATGGGDNRGPWLRDLDTGACFLARPKDSTTGMLFEFWIVTKAVRAIKLLSIRDDKETYIWVDPEVFSNELKLYEVMDP